MPVVLQSSLAVDFPVYPSMTHEKPETFQQYFSLQIRRLKQWVKPDPSDALAVTVLKTILKSVAVLLLLIFSPVLILGLTLAFFATF